MIKQTNNCLNLIQAFDESLQFRSLRHFSAHSVVSFTFNNSIVVSIKKSFILDHFIELVFLLLFVSIDQFFVYRFLFKKSIME